MWKPFENHPAPWKYVENAATCGNGGTIHTIEDAGGEVVASSYNCGFYELWAMYCVLTPEQEFYLGRADPDATGPAPDPGADE